jgi:LysR family transcriptional regulator, glycine cleavage system transcriptional activator
MPRRLPPLNAVRAFEAAGRHVSFTKAAVELDVTHGAVSRQVALLEEWLGFPLFRRTSSQLSLTEAGRAYLAEATAALDRLAMASMQPTDASTPTGLHVSGPPTFTMRWLLARMSAFQRRWPDVEVRLTTSLAPVNFLEHPYDIAIRGAQAPFTGGISKPFMTELVVPVCHTDMIEQGRLAKPEDLSKETLISYSTEPYPWPEWLELAGVPDLKPAAALNFEEMYYALQAAVEGLGVVLIPLFLAIDDINAGRLCTPFGRLGGKQRQYYATAVQNTPVIDAFFDWLLEEGQATERAMSEWAQASGCRRADLLPL